MAVALQSGDDMELGIGTNYVRVNGESNAMLMVEGARIFSIELSSGPLLPSLNVWDVKGSRVAKLNRGAWVFNDSGLQIDTAPDHLVLRDDDHVLAEIERTRPDYVWLRRLDIYARNGVRLLIDESNDFDLELLQDGVSLVRVRRSAFYFPKAVVDIVDTGAGTLTHEGIIASREFPGLQVEHCTFGSPDALPGNDGAELTAR